MTQSATINLEVIKLQLIQNRQFGARPGNEYRLSKEAIKYLIRALEYADHGFTQEIEGVLAKCGEEVIPALIKGLTSHSVNVKSTCAMALIRIGDSALEPVKQFYSRNVQRDSVNWIASFILEEMGEVATRPETMAIEPSLSYSQANLPSLSRVG